MSLGIFNGLAALNTAGDILVLASPSVEVREEAGGTLVSLFSDRAGSSGIANPFTGNADGSFSFYVAGNRYHITATLGGDSVEWRNVPIGLMQEHDSVSEAEIDSSAVTETKIAAEAVSQGKLEAALSVLLLWPRIRGLVPSNDGSDATNDIDIAAGVAISSAGVIGSLPSTFVKKADATFAKGTAAGGMYSGGTWGADDWHIWLIREDSTGDGDIYIDSSVTGANVPADWTLVKRVASIRTAGAAWPTVSAREIAGGGIEVLLGTPAFEFQDTTNNDNAHTHTLELVPGDLQVEAILGCSLLDSTPASASSILITSLDQSDTAPSNGQSVFLSVFKIAGAGAGVQQASAGEVRVRTSTSRTFRSRKSASTADHSFSACTLGWIDERI